MVVAVGCGTTMPAAHVEVLHKGSGPVYVGGAGAPGLSRKQACRRAIDRSVAAIANAFAEANHNALETTLADAVGVQDARALLYRYARDAAQTARVPDLRFDPGRNVCLASVRFQPPLFLRDAVLTYARELHARARARARLQDGAHQTARVVDMAPTGDEPQEQGAPATQQRPTRHFTTVPPGSAAPPPRPCKSQQQAMHRLQIKTQRRRGELAECLRRTHHDRTACHRYDLYVQQVEGERKVGLQGLQECLEAVRMTATSTGAQRS